MTIESGAPREITFRDLYDIAKGSWLAILLMVVGAGAIATWIAWAMTPVYRATVLLSPSGSDGGGGNMLSKLAGQFAPLAGLAGGGQSGTGYDGKDVWIATLKSRYLVETFIKERDLLPQLFPKRWDSKLGQWKSSDGAPMVPTMDAAWLLFGDEILSVSEDRRTGLVTLTVEWHDRNVVADWANALVKRTNELARARAIEDAEKSLEYLKREVAKTQIAALQTAIYSIIETKVSQTMLANVREDYAFVTIDPAVVPSPGNFVRPRRLVIVAVGILLGLLAGLGIGIGRWLRRP